MPMKVTPDPYADLAALFLGEDGGRDTVAAAAVADDRAVDARERIELVLPGNLPVMGSLWIAQYADLIGRREGPTALVRFGTGEVTVEVFRAGTQPVGLDSAADLEGAIQDLAGRAGSWFPPTRPNSMSRRPRRPRRC
jgi:hypothetical protein